MEDYIDMEHDAMKHNQGVVYCYKNNTNFIVKMHYVKIREHGMQTNQHPRTLKSLCTGGGKRGWACGTSSAYKEF